MARLEDLQDALDIAEARRDLEPTVSLDDYLAQREPTGAVACTELILDEARERTWTSYRGRFSSASLRHFEVWLKTPRPFGYEPVEGSAGGFRVREADHRILYEIDDEPQVVTILRVRHRREAYRRF